MKLVIVTQWVKDPPDKKASHQVSSEVRGQNQQWRSEAGWDQGRRLCIELRKMYSCGPLG